MNVLFLTLVQFDSLQERNIYTDLLREFCRNGHQVYAISPTEKKQKIKTHVIVEENATILRLQIGNTQQTNLLEKGISTVMIQPIFKRAIRTFFSDVRFDLVLYSTPPITFVSAIEYVKKRDNAKSFLLLKDIFPQNAVDIGMMTTSGIKGLVYKHFRKKEKKLYSVSDRIGCMSQANVNYIIRHNPDINPQIVGICPNSIEVVDKSVGEETRDYIRKKYDIPLNRKVFVYGGNLGKPQGIPFLIECLKKCEELENVFFLIVGDGTEYQLLNHYVVVGNPKNVKLMKRLPREDYDAMVGACDVGLIFLDYRFTIPNYPSRLLSYMQAKLPIIAATDSNTDIANLIVDNKIGWWLESTDSEIFKNTVLSALNSNLKDMGEKAFSCLIDYFSVKDCYEDIIRKLD